jgi:hypothetical protein
MALENLMTINIKEKDAKHGLLGLMIALVEMVEDNLKVQAMKRMESGRLAGAEYDRLVTALLELHYTLEDLKSLREIGESAQLIRDGLDDIVDSAIDNILDPQESFRKPN